VREVALPSAAASVKIFFIRASGGLTDILYQAE
jgi:hypothetical protein